MDIPADSPTSQTPPQPPSGQSYEQRWQSSVTRRVRVLLRTAPLHQLEAAKARHSSWDRLDVRAVALRILDVVIEAMGWSGGADRDSIIESVAPMVTAMTPKLADEAEEVIGHVLDSLLNESQRRTAFSEPYTDWSTEPPVRREVSFHLLEEHERPDGSYVIRASTEGINVYTGMLSFEVQDAQVAEEAVLHVQIERGRIGDALQTAQNARLRSIELQETLQRVLRLVRRDVLQVRWREEVVGHLDGARQHISDRIDAERRMLQMVADRLDRASEQDGPSFASLRETLLDCLKRHLALQGEVGAANDTFLDEQQRQVFRRLGTSRLPDLEAEVTNRAFSLPMADVGNMLPSLLQTMISATARPVLSLSHLVDTMLAPPPVRHTPEAPPEPKLEEVSASKPYFTDQDILLVEDVLSEVAGESSARLQELLMRVQQRGGTARAEQYMVLRLLQAWGDEQSSRQQGWLVHHVGELDSEHFWGDDVALTISRGDEADE